MLTLADFIGIWIILILITPYLIYFNNVVLGLKKKEFLYNINKNNATNYIFIINILIVIALEYFDSTIYEFLIDNKKIETNEELFIIQLINVFIYIIIYIFMIYRYYKFNIYYWLQYYNKNQSLNIPNINNIENRLTNLINIIKALSLGIASIEFFYIFIESLKYQKLNTFNFILIIMLNLIYLIILLSVNGKNIGLKNIYFFVIIINFFNLCIAIILFLEYILKKNIVETVNICNWIKIELFTVKWGILIDPLSITMLFVITLISFSAQLYSIEYLNEDPHLSRYFSYISLFTFFMILLVFSENMVMLFIGWEGVGICSYLLINFWYSRIQANKSSILAILANKIGDISLLISILIIQYTYKTTSFKTIQDYSIYIYNYKNNIWNYIISLENYEKTQLKIQYENEFNWILNIFNFETFYNSIKLELIALSIIIACIGKSAQFGFHFWLPEAMEGPTPVSSLIHAATMVTAGIFLILRLSDFFINVNNIFIFIITIGAITLFFASTIGLLQTDIKKIVAYSTCSQLGYMFLSCGFQNYINSMYHLFIHAFFKALLFLTSGYIIHLLSNEQDIRKMGGLLKIFPFSYILLLIGSFGLIGFPFIGGFYSKESIIEKALNFYNNTTFTYYNLIIITVLFFTLITTIISLLYSIKTIIDIFYFNYNGLKKTLFNIHYSSVYIQIPLFILSMITIYSGYLFEDLFIGINNNFVAKSVFIEDSHVNLIFKNLKATNLINNYDYNIIQTNKKHIIETANFITEYNNYNRSLIIYILIYSLIIYIIIQYILQKYIHKFIISNYTLYSDINKKYNILNKLLINLLKNLLKNYKNYFFFVIEKGFLEIPYIFKYIINLLINSNLLSKLKKNMIYHNIGYIYTFIVFFIYILIYII